MLFRKPQGIAMIFGKSSDSSSQYSHDDSLRNSENTRILALLAQDYIKDKKYQRRWRLFFKLFIVTYLVGASFWYFLDAGLEDTGSHTALIKIDGLLGFEENSSDLIIRSLEDAYQTKNAKGIIISINSPGGTPVEAARINEEIYRLKSLYPGKPLHVVVNDICASGGYYIAVAADRIFAHPSSIVGSIGVIMSSFGFTDTMEKIGIERRQVQAGENKSMFDPFSPLKTKHYLHAQSMVNDVHQQFITAVKQGRGDKLSNHPDIFSGLVWSGRQAMDLGLIDDYGSLQSVAREVIGETNIVDYTQYPDIFEQIRQDIGVSVSNYLLNNPFKLQ